MPGNHDVLGRHVAEERLCEAANIGHGDDTVAGELADPRDPAAVSARIFDDQTS
jgi:hypothetical protein